MASNLPWPTRKTISGSNTDGQTQATGSITPTSGYVYLALFAAYNSGGSAPAQPTFTGTNGFNATWTVAASVAGGTTIRVTIAWAVAVSGSAGTITADYGSTQQAHAWAVYECPVPNTSTTPITQSKTNSATGSSASFTVTLDNAVAKFGIVIAAMALNLTSGSALSAAAAFDQQGGSQSVTDGLDFQVIVGVSTAPNITFGTANCDKAGVAVEIAHDGTGAAAGRGVGPAVLGL